ncbi:hypothetical protein CASFOL_016549 [Castilleja foliolosa]|uniref:Rieske domain-containing protein n=1 Tax=Castilleja foliolosa TaxID=1961234 RepID=A0ABD3DCV8_9LAMI
MATAATKFTIAGLFSAAPAPRRHKPSHHHLLPLSKIPLTLSHTRVWVTKCQATEVSPPSSSSASAGDGKNWVPVVPLSALPKGERRVIIQDGETVLLLWYKDNVLAIENRSPAEGGAYSEGLLNAKLTQDGCIVCPSTDSTFDLQTGEIKEWYPKNPVLRALTPPLRTLFVYPVKTDGENIYISMKKILQSDASAEIVFSGKAQPGVTATNVNVDEGLIIPFLRFGEFITGGPHFPLSSDALKKVFTGQASKDVLHSIFHALLGWAVAAPFLSERNFQGTVRNAPL